MINALRTYHEYFTVWILDKEPVNNSFFTTSTFAAQGVALVSVYDKGQIIALETGLKFLKLTEFWSLAFLRSY
ncbi:MAG TPA: hypothetical protein PK683_08415 [Leptospiraceae bacterium]|nr:hypothetical protein [Leptospiraceae bacterium]